MEDRCRKVTEELKEANMIKEQDEQKLKDQKENHLSKMHSLR